MKSTEQLARPILECLDRWKSPRKQIVGLDGYSAAGKSTLAEYVASKRSDVVLVHVDSFLFPRDQRKQFEKENPEWKLRPDWRDSPAHRHEYLDQLLRTYRGSDESYDTDGYNPASGAWDKRYRYDFSRPFLLVEGALLLVSPAGMVLDRLIYLDTTTEDADKLRHMRIRQKGSGTDLQNHEAWSAKFEAMYSEYLRKYKPREKADLLMSVD